MSNDWYVSRAGQPTAGPYSDDYIRGMAHVGLLEPTDLVRQGNRPWTSASEFADLFGPMVNSVSQVEVGSATRSTSPRASSHQRPLLEPPMNRSTLPPNQKYCLACASVLDVRAVVCPACGVPQQPASTNPFSGSNSPSERRLVAALICFFFGAIGGHKFFLGQTGLGVLYLLFFWTAIPALVSMIEFVLFLAMSDADFAAKYPANAS